MKTLLLLGLGALVLANLKIFDCYIVPVGNQYAGQKQCRSLLSKWVGGF